MWWHILAVLALRRLRQEVCLKVKVDLSYLMISRPRTSYIVNPRPIWVGDLEENGFPKEWHY